MKEKRLRRGAGALAAVLLLGAMTVSAGAVAYQPQVTAETASAAYWTAREKAPEQRLMTAEEIAALNLSLLNSKEAGMRNIYDLPETMNTTSLVAGLCKFTAKKTYYINGKVVKAAYFEAVRSNMRDPQASAQRALRYGLACGNSNIKSLPIADVVSDSAKDPEHDVFQNAKVLTGDGVVILAESRDKAWYYIYTRSFNGWVAAKDIAVCADKAEWESYLTGEEVLVVTGSKVVLEQSVLNPASSLKLLTIGTRLPLSQKGIRLLDGRTPFENHLVLLPTRDAKGNCVLRETPVPVNRDVSVGYLPYTQGNLIQQLFKEQGDRYGWGGMFNADDCSSYLVNVYRCFGIWLPNGRDMEFVPGLIVTDLSGYSDAQKAKVIAQLPAGTILQFPGHVVCYLGQQGEELYNISALGNVTLDGTYSRVRTVSVNTLSAKRSTGKSWLSDIYFALTVRLPKFSDLESLPETEREAVLSLARRGIVREAADGKFNPDGSLDGGAAVELLSRAFRLEESWLTSGSGGGLSLGTGSVSPQRLNETLRAIWAKTGRTGTPEALDSGKTSLTRAEFCVYLQALLVGKTVEAPEGAPVDQPAAG